MKNLKIKNAPHKNEALIFAGIYYGILPLFSTFMAEKVDKFIEKQKKS